MTFPKYDEYKASGVEWLGKVPDHWTVKQLRFVADLTQGTAKIAPGPTIDADFLLAYVNSSPVQTYLSSAAKGATFKEITLETLRKTPALIPPLSEQQGSRRG